MPEVFFAAEASNTLNEQYRFPRIVTRGTLRFLPFNCSVKNAEFFFVLLTLRAPVVLGIAKHNRTVNTMRGSVRLHMRSSSDQSLCALHLCTYREQ
jgi:hypothetical protein